MKTRVVTDLATPAVLAILDAYGDTTNLNRRISVGMQDVTRRHILGNAGTRHRSAQRLGGTPTGEYERSAQRVTAKSDATGAEIQVPRFLFRRAFESFWIRAKGNFLTIPQAAASYGRRVAELRRRGWTIFRPRRRGTKARGTRIDKRKSDGSINRRRKIYGGGGLQPWLLGVRNKGDRPTLLYSLKRAVYHQQDRTLLPSDDAFIAEARRVATAYALYLAKSKGLA